MARTMPENRIEDLVDCATRVFIERGYARTQMADVAMTLGVAKGTLYLYVESKEALFDLVARYADAPRPFDPAPTLPVATPPPGATLDFVRNRLLQQQVPRALAAALDRRRVNDARAEIEAIARELYQALAENRRSLKLIDRSAPDLPELAAIWYVGARGGLITLLERYIADRTRRSLFTRMPDPTVTARLMIETLVFWAVHRHWDAHPQAVDEDVARDTVVQFIVEAIVKEKP
ncbi:MAG TPA: helix-turn-helix domain-containing protein [Candidatus Binatia bacterium]|nr:helix-turn-helix domain-containing protein [Candidatus Binatia bacterium]